MAFFFFFFGSSPNRTPIKFRGVTKKSDQMTHEYFKVVDDDDDVKVVDILKINVRF